jgi:8-oxo-dGTP pyrophosphatase MutT (NUDIX family)
MNETIEILKKLFRTPLPGEDSQKLMAPSRIFTGDKYPDPSKAKDSSVFILLFRKNEQLFIPLIKRTEYNGAHSGQISLPGGKYEPGDINLLETAYRETYEEIGIKRENIIYAGTLTTLFIPNSNFNIVPHVGFIINQPEFHTSKREVQRLITLPIDVLTDRSYVKHFERTVNGKKIFAPYYSYKGDKIWGATAMILSEFGEMIRHSSLVGRHENAV